MTSTTTPLAYPVPWRVDRSRAPTFRLVNASEEALRGVTLSLAGSAIMTASPPQRVEPEGQVSVTLHGRDLARDAVLIVRWFRPAGDEYLWRVSF